MLPALQIQSFVSAYSFDIASQSMHRMDTILLTQLHYITTLKSKSHHKVSISRFQIKSICISNPIRPSIFVTVHESIYGVWKPHLTVCLITDQEMNTTLLGVVVEVMVLLMVTMMDASIHTTMQWQRSKVQYT